MEFSLTKERVEQLELYSSLLQKDISTMLNEALELYFVEKERELLEKNLENENMLTNLDYDEFWDGVEI
jgi:hypothetical protein